MTGSSPLTSCCRLAPTWLRGASRRRPLSRPASVRLAHAGATPRMHEYLLPATSQQPGSLPDLACLSLSQMTTVMWTGPAWTLSRLTLAAPSTRCAASTCNFPRATAWPPSPLSSVPRTATTGGATTAATSPSRCRALGLGRPRTRRWALRTS